MYASLKLKSPSTVKGKNPSPSAVYKAGYPSNWSQLIRPIILFLDGFRCTVCGHFSTSNHVDHVNSNKMDCRYINLKTLCASHHGMKTKGIMTVGPRVIETNDVIFAISKDISINILKDYTNEKNK